MKVLTCNIRNSGAADGENSWLRRRELCIAVIESRAPDVICFQEMSVEQLRDLRSAFPAFEWFGTVDEPRGRNPMNSILYRGDAFTETSAGSYWLSETPHVTGSKSWDSDCIRLASWLRLEHRGSQREFRVINTHLDHVSQLARERQAQVIVEDACAFPEDYPQILTGDMNCDASNKAIDVFKSGGWQDTYTAVHGTENPGHTFHRFVGPDFEGEIGKMDWIFAKGSVEVLDAAVIDDSRDGRYPSDHYFVSADVRLAQA